MRPTPLKLLALPLFLSIAGAAIADGRQAVIIANRSYESLANVSGATAALALSKALRAADFEVSTFSNLDARGMQRAVSTIEDVMQSGDQILVLVSGQIVPSGNGHWLLATDATTPSALMPGDNALSLDALATALSGSGASAVLLAGDAQLRNMDVPQGVSVFSGDTSALTALVRDGLLMEGRSLASIADTAGRGIIASGYLPEGRAFLTSTTATAALPDGISDQDLEDFLFAKAKAANTETALSGFLQRYPSGANASIARNMLSDLTKSPTELARDVETGLRLTRADKQAVQSDLTLLGYDTNGVDGVFGRGSRSAIRRWQAANSVGANGYLTRAQISLIQDMANDTRQQGEREDAAYWRQTGRFGTADGYSAYLSRFPNGIFAQLAKQELGELQSANEARDWAQTRQANTADGYRAFLDLYPQSAYAPEAQARLDALTPSGPSQAEIAAAKAQEDKAMANVLFRVLAEQRLAGLGYNPGATDGRFDDATRAAIAGYQQANGLVATGYLDVKSLNTLLNN